MEIVNSILGALTHNTIVQLVIIAIVMDTIFGVGRAIKQHSFNSSVGIDGAIRKISMLISIIFLAVVDTLVHINLIGFIPEEARAYLPGGTIGLAEFFGLLYLCYEIVSILKNMTMCGLPVKRLWETVQKVLSKYTDELPDTEAEDAAQDAAKATATSILSAVATDDVPTGALEVNPDGTIKVYDENGQVVGSMTKEEVAAAEEAVTDVKIEQ